MKKVLLLGGSRYLRPVIKAAHELGYYTITCDYLPDNYAHKYSDEYHNVSIIDKEAVLVLAQELQVNGIMSFACDPGVVTAAYVAEKLGLPTNPYESVRIMQNKALFRNFLTENGFNVPKAKGYTSLEEALKEAYDFSWPVIVKPTDSAGSKGVTRVDDPNALKGAIVNALEYSLSSEFIVEEFIEKQGDSTDTDSFSIDGELVFASFNNQKFDLNAENPYAPCAYTWPCEMPQEIQDTLRSEIQRLIKLLNLKTSIYNIEARQGANGKPYIMECSPRGGGNRLAEVLEYATGQELIKNAVRAAVGDEVMPMTDPVYDGFWAEIVLHSDKNGKFVRLLTDEKLRPHLYQTDLWVKAGEEVHVFTAANFAIGTLVLRFDNQDEMNETVNHIYDHIQVVVQ
ncbi:MAG: ATP-grasp domain-containing protein [Clostridiales bacterium]|nr:ATP-grasp domain-containing protein [Clostridiales bacterium]